MKAKQLQLVTFEQAKKLSDIGYNWDTFAPPYWYDIKGIFHSDNFYPFDLYYAAPIIALALKWINDVKKITNGTGSVIGADKPLPHPYYWTEYYWAKYWICGDETVLKYFPTIDMAEEALLDELLNILEK
jgi:uncharacterized protein YceK